MLFASYQCPFPTDIFPGVCLMCLVANLSCLCTLSTTSNSVANELVSLQLTCRRHETRDLRITWQLYNASTIATAKRHTHAHDVISSCFLPERDYVTFGSVLSQLRLSTQYRSVTDRRTDRQTDMLSIAYTTLAKLVLWCAVIENYKQIFRGIFRKY